mmetsp:Transcript_35725/g.110934  ORF Transcript_35725/g.110934 Transcript_35725/m.110934 type:complete len:284 (+) Transcript_35725:123-974(+)
MRQSSPDGGRTPLALQPRFHSVIRDCSLRRTADRVLGAVRTQRSTTGAGLHLAIEVHEVAEEGGGHLSLRSPLCLVPLPLPLLPLHLAAFRGRLLQALERAVAPAGAPGRLPHGVLCDRLIQGQPRRAARGTLKHAPHDRLLGLRLHAVPQEPEDGPRGGQRAAGAVGFPGALRKGGPRRGGPSGAPSAGASVERGPERRCDGDGRRPEQDGVGPGGQLHREALRAGQGLAPAFVRQLHDSGVVLGRLLGAAGAQLPSEHLKRRTRLRLHEQPEAQPLQERQL